MISSYANLYYVNPVSRHVSLDRLLKDLDTSKRFKA